MRSTRMIDSLAWLYNSPIGRRSHAEVFIGDGNISTQSVVL